MRAFVKLTWVQIKLYWREPVALFFTIAYAPLMLLLFGSIYGNKPDPLLGNRGMVDVSVPAYAVLIIIAVGLISVPIGAATNREQGILRRYRVTPLRPLTYLLVDVFVYYLMTLLGMICLIAVGASVFHVHFAGNWFYVFLAFTLGTLATFAIGYLIAGVAKTARMAQSLGMIIAFPIMFLSGAALPLQVLPQNMQRFAKLIPQTYAVELLQALWFGESWGQQGTATAVLFGVMMVCALIAVKSFRWE